MKLKLSLASAGKAVSALKKAKARKAVLEADCGVIAAAAGLAALKEAADYCIERGIALELPGLTPCLLPGYARYLRAEASGTLACPRAAGCFFKNACAGIPVKYAAVQEAFKPPARGATDLEKCMLAVLAAGRELSTAQVLKAAKGIKICASCSNEGEVFRAAERLVKSGLVSKEYRGGIYLWKKI